MSLEAIHFAEEFLDSLADRAERVGVGEAVGHVYRLARELKSQSEINSEMRDILVEFVRIHHEETEWDDLGMAVMRTKRLLDL